MHRFYSFFQENEDLKRQIAEAVDDNTHLKEKLQVWSYINVQFI